MVAYSAFGVLGTEETGQWQALEQTLAAISEYMQSASLLTDMELCSHVGKAEDYRRPALVSR
jgi:pyrimidine deaminase RibD-like protein